MHGLIAKGTFTREVDVAARRFRESNAERRLTEGWVRALGTLVAALQLVCCSAGHPGEQWGVQVSSVRLTGADHFVDLRFRVIDPDRAAAFLKRGEKVFLLDQATGVRLPVPTTKLGPLRASAVKPVSGREYVMLFNNFNKVVGKRSKVTLVIGDVEVKDLSVE